MRSYEEHIVTNEELKMIQKIDLEMLVEVDRICRKYRIQYSLDGGTLLGAVRHKGFIPWDDDADVIMLRKEYRKFQKACRKELDQSRFFLQDYQTDPEYRWGYAKIRRRNTEYIRLGQEHLKQKGGVCIDIFVADNVPDQKVVRKIHYFFCYCIRKTMYPLPGDTSRGKRSSMPQPKTRPDSPVPSLQGPCDRSLKSEEP